MSESEFWDTTPRYLQARIKAKQRDSNEAWVIARQIAYWSILPHMGKKRIKPYDLARFEWEKIKELKNIYGSKEALAAEIEKFKALAMPIIERHEAQNKTQ